MPVAGIGLELRKILQVETFSAVVRAYFIGGVVVLGPFIASALCIGLLTALTRSTADIETRQAFTGAIVYVFGGSMTVTGLIHVVVTRYLADQFYRGEHGRMIDSLFPVMLMTAVVLVLVAVPCLGLFRLPPVTKLLLLTLFVIIGLLWLMMVFVTSAHHHWAVVVTFLVGSAVAGVVAYLLVPRFGLAGMLGGYAAGHFLMLVLMARQLFAELGYPKRWEWGVLGHLRTFPMLIFIGVLLNLGVWVDEFVFWTSDLQLDASGLVTAPKYDSSTFVAYLTVLPAMVHFFVRTEADFSEQFHVYYDEVFFRSSLERITAAAAGLRGGIIRALLDILKVQGAVTFLGAFFAVELLAALDLPVSQVGIFRFSVVGSLFLVFMMFANVILLYLDRQREVLITGVVFLALNLGLSIASLKLGYQFYGMGFAASSLVALCLSLLFLANQLYNLEYMTFAARPLTGQRRAKSSLQVLGGWYGRYNPVKPAGTGAKS
ncbi:MAG: exopolysaccharide Pel transporter PelG [Myxococcaceae bacterium]